MRDNGTRDWKTQPQQPTMANPTKLTPRLQPVLLRLQHLKRRQALQLESCIGFAAFTPLPFVLILTLATAARQPRGRRRRRKRFRFAQTAVAARKAPLRLGSCLRCAGLRSLSCKCCFQARFWQQTEAGLFTPPAASKAPAEDAKSAKKSKVSVPQLCC